MNLGDDPGGVVCVDTSGYAHRHHGMDGVAWMQDGGQTSSYMIRTCMYVRFNEHIHDDMTMTHAHSLGKI